MLERESLMIPSLCERGGMDQISSWVWFLFSFNPSVRLMTLSQRCSWSGILLPKEWPVHEQHRHPWELMRKARSQASPDLWNQYLRLSKLPRL